MTSPRRAPAGGLILVPVLALVLAGPGRLEAGEVLYNGIELPQSWPPRVAKLSRDPMPVPYLAAPPKVIPIDVGRQLFVDDFLVEQTTLTRTFHRPEFHRLNPVVTFDKPWELTGRAPFAAVFSDGVWFDPQDRLFKMWYCGGYLAGTCYATSTDGIRWDKPALEVEPGSNYVLRHERDSSTVWLDPTDPDPARRFKMFTTQRANEWCLALRCSSNGVHWSKPLATSPSLGDRSTVFYNPFRKVWVWSLRTSQPGTGRSRAYREHPDPVKGMAWQASDVTLWTGADRLDPRHPKFPGVDPQLYNLDAVAYESVMLGLFSIHQGPPNHQCSQLKIQKRNEVLLGFSRDGFHWHRPDRRPFLGVTERDGDWRWGNMQSAGGGCLVVGDKLYFYVSGRQRTDQFWDGRASTGLATLRRDGFASVDAGAEPGTLTTRPLRFRGEHLFVNVDTAGGELRVEILDAHGRPQAPFLRDTCLPVRTNRTLCPVRWSDAASLSALKGQTVRFRFHLRNGRLYAFWVSPTARGESRGYVAAGGPGLTGMTDTVGQGAGTPNRPNLLWITSEDNSPYLGCYGDPLARTPNLDRLAAQGVRYRNAFANAPVCSSARTTLITGMYASSLGAHNHRSRVAMPGRFKLYPEHLRAAGYHCSNNSKTDYNLAGTRQSWDESSPKAHYNHRAPGQPFFAVFNFTTSHESQVAPKPGKTSFRVPPETIPLPPYHPDTPEIRRDWANYYDQVTLLDGQAGKVLDELQKAGLDDDTIVFYYADHGGALPRGKRNIHDSGTRVPLIIRFPEKWRHLAPAAPGQWVPDLVSFVDFPATVLSLCGVPVPAHYEGRPFLGAQKPPPRDHVFLFRGRMDERYDTVRAVRDGGFRYVRNYSPHRPWGQHYSYPFQVLPSMRSWFAEFAAGRCNEVQAAYWNPKPAEEFYEIASDPFEVRNRIAEPQHAARIARLRAALRADILATRDTGFIPEGMAARRAGDMPLHDWAHTDAYPLERILDLADKTGERNAAHLPALIAALGDSDPVLRYWAATGCLILAAEAGPAKAKLLALLDDPWADVRVTAAEALAHLGERDKALQTLAAVLKTGNLHEALAAQNALDSLRQAGLVPLAMARDLVRDLNFGEPGNRIPRYLLSQP
ncbi:MAG: sulfatase-like hydrolase/transferase [Verrucomicrobia bacterium]|nr:sulfatase-like hydrolase/transferase [Verrucomicrobiota bacterium]